MTPTDPTETTPAQEAVAAPPAPEATGTGTPPSGGKGRPAKAKSGAKKGKGRGKAKTGQKQAKSGVRKIGADARREAFRLIVEGLPLAAIARRLRVKRDTIAAWRDSEEGIATLKELRTAREAELGTTLKNSRLQLETALPRAVQVMTDLLDSPDPKVRLRAAAQICDRGGVIRTERLLDGDGDSAIDLSTLTPEELETLRALHAKAARGAA